MLQIKIFLLLFLTIFTFGDNYTFGKSSIVKSRTIDGTTYHIVQANAKTMSDNTADGTPTGKKSLVFNNLLGKIAISKKSYDHIPNIHNGKVTVYYLIKEGEESKQKHELFFKRKNINFPAYSLDRDNNNYKKNIPYEQKSKVPYDGIYLPLFIFFLILSSFFDNRSVSFIPIKIRLMLQAAIIFIFFVGANKIINVENKECSQSVIETTGTVKYHVFDEPYVIFKNCNGDNSRSQMNVPELESYNEYSPVTIFYSQETQEGSVDNRGHRFAYKVFFSKEDFLEKSETPLRKKVAVFMLFIWLYFVLNYRKKLTLPLSMQNRNTYFKVDPYNIDFHEVLSKIQPEKYDTENYDTHYKIYTDFSNRIHIKSTDIFSLILPAVVFLGLFWALSRLFPSIFMGAVPDDQIKNFYGITFGIFIFAAVFLFIAIKSIKAIKHIGIFNYKRKRYQAFNYDETVPFEKIYGLTIIYKKIEIESSEDTYYQKLFILDLLLKNGEVINLVANENRDILLAEAKIISSYIQKPIWDFGKWNYYELKNIYNNSLNEKSKP